MGQEEAEDLMEWLKSEMVMGLRKHLTCPYCQIMTLGALNRDLDILWCMMCGYLRTSVMLSDPHVSMVPERTLTLRRLGWTDSHDLHR